MSASQRQLIIVGVVDSGGKAYTALHHGQRADGYYQLFVTLAKMWDMKALETKSLVVGTGIRAVRTRD